MSWKLVNLPREQTEERCLEVGSAERRQDILGQDRTIIRPHPKNRGAVGKSDQTWKFRIVAVMEKLGSAVEKVCVTEVQVETPAGSECLGCWIPDFSPELSRAIMGRQPLHSPDL